VTIFITIVAMKVTSLRVVSSSSTMTSSSLIFHDLYLLCLHVLEGFQTYQQGLVVINPFDSSIAIVMGSIFLGRLLKTFSTMDVF
jgi:hypothetical protein